MKLIQKINQRVGRLNMHKKPVSIGSNPRTVWRFEHDYDIVEVRCTWNAVKLVTVVSTATICRDTCCLLTEFLITLRCGVKWFYPSARKVWAQILVLLQNRIRIIIVCENILSRRIKRDSVFSLQLCWLPLTQIFASAFWSKATNMKVFNSSGLAN